MFHSFLSRYLKTYLFLAFAIFIFFTSLFNKVVENYFIKQQQERMVQESKSISYQYIKAYYGDQMDAIDFNQYIQILSYHLQARIWVMSKGGSIYIDSERGYYSLGGKKIDNDSINRALDGEIITMTGTFHGMFDQRVITVAVPVIANHEIKGIIVMHSNIPTLEKNLRFIYVFTFIFLIITILLLSILNFIFSRRISLFFNEINKTATAIANGDFNTRVTEHSEKEFKDVANNLNYMAIELEKLEDMRKSFIANISHDIRSPLTSIKGYVQAILDKTISYEHQEKYLNIVLDEANRLAKLTNDILLLNSMENSEMTVERTNFDIHYMIRKTLSQFEQKIVNKKIDITLLIDKKELYVIGDIDKIQRVIYNLIDNAVKFCEEDDKITIETSLTGSKATVVIEDTGPGINKNELKYIWDRFYKGDPSRGKHRQGTGLGLSIVRQIIKAHDEKITVTSEENVGTRFSFTLPATDYSRKLFQK